MIMEKDLFLQVFLSEVRNLTDTKSVNDCRVIEYIESLIPELKKFGFTVGYAYEPRLIHLVGKVESKNSIANYGICDISIINGIIISGLDFKIISKHEINPQKIRCTPLPNNLDFNFKTEQSEDYENPFWLIEPQNFEHIKFIGIAQSAYCIGFISDCL